MKNIFAAAFVVILSLCFCVSTRANAARTYAFDLRRQAHTLAAKSSATGETGVVRETRLGPGAARADALAVGDVLSFILFDDRTVELTLVERTESPLGGASFIARASDAALANAVVLETDEGIQANVQDFATGRVYVVASDASKTLVRELDPAAGETTPCEALVPELTRTSTVMAMSANADQPSTLVDVLVAYDTGALAWANQNGGGITNFANAAVTKMNAALANSGLGSNFRFRLVGVTTLNASATDVHAALYAIRDDETGWADVKAVRDEVGADIVTTLIDTGTAYGTSGVGWSLQTTDMARFSESAYNVCAVRSVAQSETMTHEVGHNMGAGHATAVTSDKDPGPQLYDYSAGYYFTGADDGVSYHTIMAYNDDGYGNHYTSAPLFSTPNQTWAGTAAGDAAHDNALTISNTYRTVSTWRAQKIAMSYDVFFSPESGATFADSLSVALTPGKSGLPIYYTLDGSTPTVNSTRYTGPITLTATTTIRAITVTDGVAGPVYEATYSVSDLGTGVDAPQLAWTTSSDYPWTFQTTDTYDGVDAVQSGEIPDGTTGTTWLRTTIAGPTTMSFRYRKTMYSSTFKVTSDSDTLYSDTEGGYMTDWALAEVEIPSGSHTVTFSFAQHGYYTGAFDGIWLDTIQFDALSRPPTMTPATTTDESTATVFTNAMTVTLSPPTGRTGTIFYTLDGSDPAGETALVYESPIPLTVSTRIRAVFVESGKEPSTEVGGLFLERHPVQPGEWTTDVAGAKEAAARDGKLIAVLLANLKTCGWCQAFDPIAESDEFLAWAKANGIYLVSADSSTHVDAEAAQSYFWSLRSSYGDSGSAAYPMLYFVAPGEPDEAIATGLARNNGSTIGTVPYTDTVESLIAGFASVLGETAPSAPTASPDKTLVDGFPHTVTLSNPNATGAIYYTLDGSAPMRENGTAYTGAITIPSSGVTLKAVVWTSAALSSPVLVKNYQSVSEWANGVYGTRGITWTLSGDYEWETASDGVSLRTGGWLNGTTYTSTLSASVTGKGKFVFTYKIASFTWRNTLAFSRDGTQQWSYGYDSSTTRTGTVTNEVTDAATFSWTYTVADASRDYSAAYQVRCGAWLSDVQWIPETSATSQGAPYALFDAAFPATASRTAAEYEALAVEDADGDGFLNWEELVCGTNPETADEKPMCFISMNGTTPTVTHNVNIPESASALGWTTTIQGKTLLTDDWGVKTPNSRFFRVVVTQ